MGIGAGSLDTSDEQVAFWNVWNEATSAERQKMGVMIGKESNRLLKSEGLTAEEIRKRLARFVKSQIIRKPRSPRRRSR